MTSSMSRSDSEIIEEISQEMITLVEKRGPDKTCCPSEVPRKLFKSRWREYLDLTRYVAFHLAKTGEIEICKKGVKVEDESVGGAIRLRVKLKY